jgi:hypothetical protein
MIENTEHLFKNLFMSFLCETLHTALPAKIISFDSKKNMAKVKPLIKKRFRNNDTILELKEIYNVPVVNFSFVNCGLSIPEDEYTNQECLLIFCERDIGNWKETGNDSTPESLNKYNLSDGIAVMSLNNSKKQVKQNDNFSLYFYDHKIEITKDELKIKGNNEITIKKNGDITLGSGVVKALMTDSIIDKFNMHTHLVNSIGAPTTTAALSTPVVLLDATDATLKVKGE